MSDSLSPEEKLLKLIKGEGGPKSSDKKIINRIAAPGKKGDVSVLPSLGKYKKTETSPFFRFQLQHLLTVVLALSVAFLTTAFLYPMLGLNKIKLPAVEKDDEILTTSEVKPEVKPLESYLAGLKSKQIFAASVSSDGSSAQPVAVTSTLDLFKDITLVGIISSNPPQAVIEDKKTQKTYYLSRGQSIGDLKVDDIQEGKVVLDYSGTKYELYM